MVLFLARIAAKIIVGFIALTLLLVLVFRWVPVPVTATMVMDDNGITKDWESLANIDPNLVHAVIAAEDSKFCEHSGFDTEAIQAAKRSKWNPAKKNGVPVKIWVPLSIRFEQ